MQIVETLFSAFLWQKHWCKYRINSKPFSLLLLYGLHTSEQESRERINESLNSRRNFCVSSSLSSIFVFFFACYRFPPWIRKLSVASRLWKCADDDVSKKESSENEISFWRCSKCLILVDHTINRTETNIKKFSLRKKKRHKKSRQSEIFPVSNKLSMKNRFLRWLQPFVGPLNHIKVYDSVGRGINFFLLPLESGTYPMVWFRAVMSNIP